MERAGELLDPLCPSSRSLSPASPGLFFLAHSDGSGWGRGRPYALVAFVKTVSNFHRRGCDGHHILFDFPAPPPARH